MRSTSAVALACVLSSSATFAQAKEQDKPAKKEAAPAIEPRAVEVLKRMSTYLASLPKLSFHVDTSRELVTDDGMKVQFHASANIFLSRPDKLRADWLRGTSEASVFYDGKAFAVQRKGAEYYATAPAPPTVDQAIDVLRDKLQVDAPAADFLFSDPFAVLTKEVQAGAYLNTDNIDGTQCDHLIFRGTEVDWQVWIETGAKPVPRKLVITSKKLKGQPQLEASLSKWDVAPELAADLFKFTPPAGATQIDFMAAEEAAKGKTKTKTQAKTKGERKEQ
jgi:hypothetical protein